jgi:CRISPR-associated protein Csx10
MYIEYRVEFEEYWRVGSGEGAGRHLDALVRRDGYGLPFVPGTTIRGLVRDGLREIARLAGRALCSASSQGDGLPCGVRDGAGACAMCRLFGSPHREGATAWQPARLEIEALNAMEAGPTRRGVAAQVLLEPPVVVRAHPRTAIDLRSGRADDDKLFALEEANRGLTLRGRVDLDDALGPDEVALLVGALRWVREIGGGRRRGLGRARVTIESAELGLFPGWQAAVEHLRTIEATTPPAAPSVRRSQVPVRPAEVGSAEIVAVEATVVGELVVARRPQAGNLVPGCLHVPGSTLRGAWANAWQGDRTTKDFDECFLSGTVRFGFLYPVLDEGPTAFPPLLSKHTCKAEPGEPADGGHGATDLLAEPERALCHCGAALVPHGPGDGQPTLHLSPHNRIDPGTQTVAKEALFAYEALPEGFTLRGYVRAAEPGVLARLLGGIGVRSLEPPDNGVRLRLGRRRRTLGYLRCSFGRTAGTDDGTLYPDARGPTGVRASEPARIDLLTPAILLDSRDVRYRTKLSPRDVGLDRDEFAGAFAGWQTVYGWHSAQRLPKPDQVALAAGSSFRLDAVTAEEFAALSKAARDGIGLRREEGFGAIAVRPLAGDE